MGYIDGRVIKELRERKKMTQRELAKEIMVSDKAISKWETGNGYPDIGIIESLSKALGVSIVELFTGEFRTNENVSANMLKSKFYVCPICKNIIYSIGEAMLSCCGITLPPQEAEEFDEEHSLSIETVDNEYHIFGNHVMTKDHYISFVAYVTGGGVNMVKLYPEGDISIRFRKNGRGFLYFYCNRHGLFNTRI